jgi:stage II sporulation protein D
MRKATRIWIAVLATCLIAATGAAGATTYWSVRGAGWGHGVGMSQYGAYGYAKHGVDYRTILRHYYTGTDIGDAGSRTIRVLLRGNARSTGFRGATEACGRHLKNDRAYRVGRRGDSLILASARGRRLATCDAPLTATGDGSLVISGLGRYRGALEVRPSLFGGVNVINALPLESYVKGVVPNESPSSWPPEALKAQAVAARSYALATGGTGLGFDQFADTRSQVYRGLSSEKPTSNRAVEATRGEIVTYGGKVAVTYFFSTSGGRTENVELAFSGPARPWLKSVDDPYDDASPYHRWGPYRVSRATFQRRLGSLVPGTFRGIKVLERGRSPRIVVAEIIGSRGTRRVSGSTLRARLGLRDTWVYFTKVTKGKTRSTDEEPAPSEPTTTMPSVPDVGSGGTPPPPAGLTLPQPATAPPPQR